MLFDVKAKQYGNSISYEVEAFDIKGALKAALKDAKDYFDYKDGVGVPEPTVSVKPSKEAIVNPED